MQTKVISGVQRAQAPASVAQVTETQCAPTRTVCQRSRPSLLNPYTSTHIQTSLQW